MKLLFAIIAGSFVTISGFSQSSFQTVRGFALPESIGSFSLRSVIDNERDRRGLGSSVNYHAPGVKASVYIYDFGIRQLPEGTDSDKVQKHFSQTKADVLTVFPKAQVLLQEESVTAGRLPLLHAAFRYTEERVGRRDPLISHLYLGSYRGSFIKVRISYLSDDALGHRLHIKFVEELCQHLGK